MTTQREKDIEYATFRDNVTTGTLTAFADGAAYGRKDAAQQLRDIYARGDWKDVRALIERLEADE